MNVHSRQAWQTLVPKHEIQLGSSEVDMSLSLDFLGGLL